MKVPMNHSSCASAIFNLHRHVLKKASSTLAGTSAVSYNNYNYNNNNTLSVSKKSFYTTETESKVLSGFNREISERKFEQDLLPGSRAFVECDRAAIIDLFHQYAKDCDVAGKHLDMEGLAKCLRSIGEDTNPETVRRLFQLADVDGNGVVELDEFLTSSDIILGGAPARIVLVVGGPGSGKGLLSKRLEAECNVVHLSSGDLLREEVSRGTILGNEVAEVMERGELVSSAVIVTLIRRAMRNHPGKRVLLDGFPRSLQNAHDLVEICGTPELALHLECDDTILMERILKRGEEKNSGRLDDNVHTALRRLRTYHKYHHSTMEWLREEHVPVVNLDCSGTAEQVWSQLEAIGRLMRPATQIKKNATTTSSAASSVIGDANNESVA